MRWQKKTAELQKEKVSLEKRVNERTQELKSLKDGLVNRVSEKN